MIGLKMQTFYPNYDSESYEEITDMWHIFSPNFYFSQVYFQLKLAQYETPTNAGLLQCWMARPGTFPIGDANKNYCK